MLQMPLNVQLDDSSRFENFVVGDSQQLLIRLKSLVKNPGLFVYVWGANESGKSHLAQALCQQFNENNLAAAYLPLANQQLQAEILIGMNHMDLICLDDINAIQGQASWEQGVFDLYNNLKIENKCLLVFSDQAPANSLFRLADLKSRLAAMEIYKLDPLNDQQKQLFFQQRAANRGIEISDEVAKFVLARLSRSVSDLINLLDQIDRSSIALQRKVTIPLIKEIFQI